MIIRGWVSISILNKGLAAAATLNDAVAGPGVLEKLDIRVRPAPVEGLGNQWVIRPGMAGETLGAGLKASVIGPTGSIGGIGVRKISHCCVFLCSGCVCYTRSGVC